MRRFYINCTIRVLLLSATIILLAYLFFETDFMAAAIFLCLLAAYQVFAKLLHVPGQIYMLCRSHAAFILPDICCLNTLWSISETSDLQMWNSFSSASDMLQYALL